MEEPLVSVVVPTRTSEYKIIPSIESLINQTYKNLEILIIDDHGANATKGIVEGFAKKDPRVKYVLNPKMDEKRKNWRGYDINAGYNARDYGFRIAKGGWITTQDADDECLLNRIEVQMHFAQKYNASMVTIQWMRRLDEFVGKTLDVEKLIRDRGEESLLIRPEEITHLAEEVRGPLMREPLHRFIPFTLKWFPYTRKLFYRRMDSYPGSDNAMLFRREILTLARFRSRNERTWGAPSGRGSGRDFAFQVAYYFKNSFSLRIPLYLWSRDQEHPDYPSAEFGKYIR